MMSFALNNDELCIKSDEFCIKNDEFCIKTWGEGAFDIKREAAMALWQLCKDGRHLSSAVEAGALPLFLDLIRVPDVEVARLGLCFTQVVLDLMKGGVEMVEEHDGIEAIESVQFYADEFLSGLSSFLVNKFYGEDYGLEDEEEEAGGGGGGGLFQPEELPPWRMGGSPQQAPQPAAAGAGAAAGGDDDDL